MKDFFTLKKKAFELRHKGLSYNEIKRKVPVAKSTLSLWLKYMKLKPEHQQRLYTKQVQILARGPQSQKERRAREIEELIKNAENEIGFPLPTEAFRLMGAALYWAEGNKQGMCEVANSDPHLIAFMVRWIKSTFGVFPTELRARLNIYPQQNERKIKKFWSELTGIPVKNFGKSFIKPISSGYKKNNLYYGTIKIGVLKSVDMRHRIFGWISAVLKKLNPEVKLVQKRWESLTRTQRPTPANLG